MSSKTKKISKSIKNRITNYGGDNTGKSCESVNLKTRLNDCNYIIKKFFNDFNTHINNLNNEINTINKLSLIYSDNGISVINQHNEKKFLLFRFGRTLGEGSFGKVILSNIKDRNNKEYNISIKIIKINNDIGLLNKEIFLIRKASYFLEKKKTPHFLFYYNRIISNQHAVIFFEKLSGSVLDNNMNNILNIDKKNYLFNIQNIVTQIFLSIFSFHKYIGHYHNDTKFNNFLYIYDKHITNNMFYYKYIYNNKKYYLPCTKFVIIIADYGFAESMENTNIIYLPTIGFNDFNIKYLHKRDQPQKYTNLIVDYLSVIDSLLYYYKDVAFLKDVKQFLLKFNTYSLTFYENHKNDKDFINKIENVLLYQLIKQEWFQLKPYTNNLNENFVINKNAPYNLSI